jgi:hypothetical protein
MSWSKTVFNEKAAPSPSSEPPRSNGKPSTRWKKGQSGNPRGRPKSDFKLRDLAQAHCREGLEKLVKIMRDPKTKPETVLAAVGMLWDRGFGRAPASLDVNHSLGIADEFEALLRQIQGERRNGSDASVHEMKVITGSAYAGCEGDRS